MENEIKVGDKVYYKLDHSLIMTVNEIIDNEHYKCFWRGSNKEFFEKVFSISEIVICPPCKKMSDAEILKDFM
jgi:hypothetical protein